MCVYKREREFNGYICIYITIYIYIYIYIYKRERVQWIYIYIYIYIIYRERGGEDRNDERKDTKEI